MTFPDYILVGACLVFALLVFHYSKGERQAAALREKALFRLIADLQDRLTAKDLNGYMALREVAEKRAEPANSQSSRAPPPEVDQLLSPGAMVDDFEREFNGR